MAASARKSIIAPIGFQAALNQSQLNVSGYMNTSHHQQFAE